MSMSMLHVFLVPHLYGVSTEVMNVCFNTYPAWSPKTAFQHSEGSCLSGPWRPHWLQPSASSRGQINNNKNQARWKILVFIKEKKGRPCCLCTCFFHSGWTLLQYFRTMFLMFSLHRCSEACRHHRIDNEEFALLILQILTCTYAFFYLYVMCVGCVCTSTREGGGVGQLLSKTLLGRFFRRFFRKE